MTLRSFPNVVPAWGLPLNEGIPSTGRLNVWMNGIKPAQMYDALVPQNILSVYDDDVLVRSVYSAVLGQHRRRDFLHAKLLSNFIASHVSGEEAPVSCTGR